MRTMPRALSDTAAGASLFAVALALSVGFSCVGLRNNLLEAHEFRQVQTAGVFLAPQHRDSDRGMPSRRIALPPGATGEVGLRTLPGPASNISCDWAYWARVEIH
jgi:hypothetical protein